MSEEVGWFLIGSLLVSSRLLSSFPLSHVSLGWVETTLLRILAGKRLVQAPRLHILDQHCYFNTPSVG
jgi:hypothetical protein